MENLGKPAQSTKLVRRSFVPLKWGRAVQVGVSYYAAAKETLVGFVLLIGKHAADSLVYHHLELAIFLWVTGRLGRK
jgi:hypothetical protein